MQIENSVAVVTGANRGLGRALAAELARRGATVYAGARRPESVDIAGVTPLRLDISDADLLAEAAQNASDATLLINNAGIATWANLLTGDLSDIRAELEIHYLGTLQATRAFVPVLERNGGGTIMNIMSVLSWLHSTKHAAYAPAKAAEWAATNVLRVQLAPRNIHVSALYVGYIDTDMISQVDAPKNNPATIAARAIDGIAADEYEVLADQMARDVRAKLSGPITTMYPMLAPLGGPASG